MRQPHASSYTRTKLLSLIGISLVALLISTLIAINSPTDAAAASTQTRVMDFNACDQVGSSLPVNDKCRVSSSSRASATVSSINSQSSRIVMLQEVCRVTYDRIRNGLGPSWNGFFLWTAFIENTRCEGTQEWGLAILFQGGPPTAVGWTLLPNVPNAEPRYLLCGTIVLGAAIRQCTTHFTVASSRASQAIEVGRQMTSYANAGGAILLGADLNIDSRNCTMAAEARPIYISSFGGVGTSTCQTGYGVGYEADQPHAGGDGTYNTATQGSRKIDYIFFSYPRWLADYNGRSTISSVSDHNILRGEGTFTY